MIKSFVLCKPCGLLVGWEAHPTRVFALSFSVRARLLRLCRVMGLPRLPLAVSQQCGCKQ
ncbi:MAG: hypothetical protein IJV35_10035 [Neisseriaceae bacterium]|nr:hypothetical protein [Neisseriaceae bacterium]